MPRCRQERLLALQSLQTHAGEIGQGEISIDASTGNAGDDSILPEFLRHRGLTGKGAAARREQNRRDQDAEQIS